MKKLVVLMAAAVLLISVNAMAQADPDDDMIGCYFDMDGLVHCTTAAYATVEAFLLVTRPAQPTGASAWECHIAENQPGGPNTGIGGIIAVVQSAGTFAPGLPAGDYACGVGTLAPLPAGPTMHLATLTWYQLGGETQLLLSPIATPTQGNPFPQYASGDNPGQMNTLGNSTGPHELGVPVAVVNGDCPVASENDTWGGVKALYR